MKPLVQRILVPTDFSGRASAALDFALLLALQVGASLIIVHVVEPAPYDGTTSWDVLAAQHQLAAQSRLEALIEGRTKMGLEIEAMLRKGLPWEQINVAAEESSADLIVMGTRGRRGLGRILAGSITESVIQTSHIPVLVVRSP